MYNAKIVDLNADVGESFGAYKIGMDEEVIKYISSANIACGLHAGDPVVMEKTINLAAEYGVGVGAHPGYPDLQGFGRRNMALSPAEVKAYVMYQIGAIMSFARAAGVRVVHVKPHGALYNIAAKDPSIALAIVEAIKAVDEELILLALAGSEMVKAARAAGLKVAQEVFADRAYNADGTLVARSKPGAVIHDPGTAIPRAVRMVTEGKVTAINGEEVSIEADSICVHGDNPQAIEFVRKLRKALEAAGVSIKPLVDVIQKF
ncbi:LamB/YcsF family protein [Desulfofundulus salinus]|uniref:5-oxoprolinase subunit A n=1 Tax=Desulfofundulus salinus TaxID=2419843 RepID=A0A494WWX3_9FIRM|nr:5-oxoprolinase subunit PxpA [Desulfofundulus salinum]RKO68038.1 LamB/YcsF family protein [Desulfofundulus salinum]